jgi:hypothetical protein
MESESAPRFSLLERTLEQVRILLYHFMDSECSVEILTDTTIIGESGKWEYRTKNHAWTVSLDSMDFLESALGGPGNDITMTKEQFAMIFMDIMAYGMDVEEVFEIFNRSVLELGAEGKNLSKIFLSGKEIQDDYCIMFDFTMYMCYEKPAE